MKQNARENIQYSIVMSSLIFTLYLLFPPIVYLKMSNSLPDICVHEEPFGLLSVTPLRK